MTALEDANDVHAVVPTCNKDDTPVLRRKRLKHKRKLNLYNANIIVENTKYGDKIYEDYDKWIAMCYECSKALPALEYQS